MKEVYYAYRLDKERYKDNYHNIAKIRCDSREEAKERVKEWRKNINQDSWNNFNIRSFEEARRDNKLPKNEICAEL